MTKIPQLRLAWLILNTIFVLNYSLYLFLFLVKLPIRPLPNIFNTLLLILSYSTSLYTKITTPSKILKKDNFFCLILFFTRPSQLLLFPFYLLALYHVVSFVGANKSYFEKYFFYQICISLSQYQVALARTALLTEIFAVPLSFCLYLLGRSKWYTFVVYYAVVRQQFETNPSMRSVCSELRQILDRWAQGTPKVVDEYYRKGRDFLIKCHPIQK